MGCSMLPFLRHYASQFSLGLMRAAKPIIFEEEAKTPVKALVLVADLENFSQFFSQPDVHLYVAHFLNHIFAALNLSFAGGKIPWLDNDKMPGFPPPIHAKFLGDGALYIWRYDNDINLIDLFHMLSLFQGSYKKIIAELVADFPVVDVPSGIRFGLAAGSVYRLTSSTSSTAHEYVGYAINLASRLQNYCRGVRFICSARVDLPASHLSQFSSYKRVIAKKLKGLPREIVIVESDDFQNADASERDALFDEITPSKESPPT
jgi:class 3 adenylate cyclase